MKSDERQRVIDSVPIYDADAALRALVATLDADGELDRALAQALAFRSGEALDLWARLVDARAAWRAQRELPPAPMPFALGE